MRVWQGVLEELIRTRRSALEGYAYLLAGDRPTAEDLVHDAIIRAFSRARRLDNVHQAEGYVRRAILTLFLNSRRASARAMAKRHLLVDEDPPAPGDLTETHDAVVRALRGLPPRQRACVVLRFFEDLSVAESAARLGISEGAVKRYVHDAMDGLRSVLGELHEPDPPGEFATVTTSGAAS